MTGAPAPRFRQSGCRVKTILLLVGEASADFFLEYYGEWLTRHPLCRNERRCTCHRSSRRVIGIVSFRAGNNSCAIRPAATASTCWHRCHRTRSRAGNTYDPTASPTATRSPTPAKIPLADQINLRTGATVPADARQWRGGVQGSGSFRVLFDATGHAARSKRYAPPAIHRSDEAAVSHFTSGVRNQGGSGVWSSHYVKQ